MPRNTHRRKRRSAGFGGRGGWGRRLLPLLLLPVGLLVILVGRHILQPIDDGHAFLASSTPVQTGGTPVEATSAGVQVASSAPSPTATVGRPRPTVFLDPGHGGVDTGTIGTTASGDSIYEKNIALAIVNRVADHLRHDSVQVVLSRTDDALVGSQPSDYTSDGMLLTPNGVLADLQRRIDRANQSKADVLLSIHLNAFSDPSIGGTQTFYDGARPFADQNRQLASLVQSSVIAAFTAQGITVPDRGATDDQDLQAESLGALSGSYNHIVLLGPAVPGRLRASQMPGALCEVLFLSNPPEADAASQPAMQDAVAVALTTAIEQFLRDQGRLSS
jgi:N-acetylmuramoyl-L-alanine amidase